jgi:hypothetical protein
VFDANGEELFQIGFVEAIQKILPYKYAPL